MQKIQSDTLHNLLAYSSEAIVFADMAGVVLYANAAAENLYGWAPGELIGKNVDIFNSHQSHNTDDIVEAIKTTGKWQGVIIQRRKDDSVFHSELTVTLILDEDKQPIGLGSHSRDVSEYLQKEQELRDSAEKYQNIFNNSQDGIIIFNEEKFLEINPRICDITGFSKDELLIKTWPDLLHPEDLELFRQQLQSVQDETAASKEIFRVRAIHRDGSVLYFQIHLSTIKYADLDARVVMVYDITGLQKQADDINAALQEKNVLLGEVYHRTKNNMQVISGLLSLRSAYFQDPAILTAFQEITDKIQSMSLVHQKLYESRNLSSIRLDEYIKDLARLMHSSYENQDREIQIKFELAPLSVLIDTAMACGLILSELFSNAFKHAFVDRSRGCITIRLQSLAENRISLRLEDDGVGVADLEHLKNANGLGIGTVVGIIEHQMMGQIHFESTRGLACAMEFKDGIYQHRL